LALLIFKTDENRGVFCRLNKLTRTQILANNGEVSLKPPPSSNKPKSNQDSSHNKHNAQSIQMKKKTLIS
jgi:hypothetical protein